MLLVSCSPATGIICTKTGSTSCSSSPRTAQRRHSSPSMQPRHLLSAVSQSLIRMGQIPGDAILGHTLRSGLSRVLQRQLAQLLGHQLTPEVTTVGPWTAAATASLSCQFDPTGWLRDRVGASRRRPSVEASAATVEVRLRAGGIAPCALLGASFVTSALADVELAVGHAGVSVGGTRTSCIGLLGRPLIRGLPTEFGEGALNGLVRAEAPLPPGRLEVVAEGYDDADSSEFAFERAGGLLRLVLSHVVANEQWDADVIAEILRGWHA